MRDMLKKQEEMIAKLLQQQASKPEVSPSLISLNTQITLYCT